MATRQETVATPPARTVVRELVARLGTRFSTAEIEQCVSRAITDLAGSISSESLPEMALRLAAVRLGNRPAGS